MQRFTRYLLMTALGAVAALAPAFAASGNITAEPNPCTVPPGAKVCDTFVSWTTDGVQHARVFVIAANKREHKEKEFVAARSCAPGKCRASWIEKGTEYTFILYDYTGGQRGPALGHVTVTAVP